MAAGLATLIISPIIVFAGHGGSGLSADNAGASSPVAAVKSTDIVRTSRVVVHDPALQGELTPAPTPPPPPPAPTRTPKAAPATPAAPPPAPGTIEAIIQAAANKYGVSYPWMLKIARCESGLNPHAYNPAGPYYGLFQFLMSTFRAHGGTNIWDPTQQADITADMLAHGGAGAWGCA